MMMSYYYIKIYGSGCCVLQSIQPLLDDDDDDDVLATIVNFFCMNLSMQSDICTKHF